MSAGLRCGSSYLDGDAGLDFLRDDGVGLCEHHLDVAACVPLRGDDVLTSDRSLRLKMLPTEHSLIVASLDENWRTVVEIRGRLGGHTRSVSQLAAVR